MVIRFQDIETGEIRSAGGVDKKMKGALAPVNEVREGGKVSVAGKPDPRVALLEAELDAAMKEIEVLRRELSLARAELRDIGEGKVRGDKPWEREGISKRTYYRRLQKQQGQGGE